MDLSRYHLCRPSCPSCLEAAIESEVWRGRVLDLSQALVAHDSAVAAASWYSSLAPLVEFASRAREGVLELDGMKLLIPRRAISMGRQDKNYTEATRVRAEVVACLRGLDTVLWNTPRCEFPGVDFTEICTVMEALGRVFCDL